jgi:hypothetical protein
MDSNIIAMVLGGLGLIVGNGFTIKLLTSSFRESLRETFLTKEAALAMYLSKDDAQKEYATVGEVSRMWGQITDHVIEPLNQITKRLDDLFLMLARKGRNDQADGSSS